MRRFRLALFAISALGIAALALVPGCTNIPEPWPEKPGPRVLTSFAPIYCFARNVAGDDASVLNVMAETGPHHFDPGPEQAVAVRKADLFFINGLDLDNGIARKLTRSGRNKNLKLIEVAKAIPAKHLREGGCTCADHEHESHGPDHVHYDPHVWLGIPEAIKMIGLIRDELKEFDPAHAAAYEDRAARYITRLEKLQAEGKEMLAGLKDRKLLTFHDSLFYFARTFNLEIVDSIEIAPGIEPDTKTLSSLIQTCREKQVRVIAIEPQYDANNSAKTILRELTQKNIPAKLVTVDPLETAGPGELDDQFYETKMRQNLRNLADALK